MALDALLENEARAEIERIRAEGRERAEAIVAQARERAEALVESRRRALETQRQSGVVRARSAADLELAATRLNASESAMHRAFEVARQELRAITTQPAYREILSRLIQEAQGALGNIEALEVNPADVQLARELAPNVEVRENPAIEGGVRAVARSGKSGITNTLPGRLDRVRESVAPQVSRLLAE